MTEEEARMAVIEKHQLINKGMRYAIHPGYITSKYDNQRHFISFLDLRRLYKLDPKYCIDMSRPETSFGYDALLDRENMEPTLSLKYILSLVKNSTLPNRSIAHLYPLENGEYIRTKREKIYEIFKKETEAERRRLSHRKQLGFWVVIFFLFIAVFLVLLIS